MNAKFRTLEVIIINIKEIDYDGKFSVCKHRYK